ncbi:hypothetical protein LCGC14_1057920 [marine sediment metagenome]|uniref:Uncharacterized protein n=1 Tax=marine sediment metagenome TaxID=412755 RepID=A0A0F9MRP5_9ZZZZ
MSRDLTDHVRERDEAEGEHKLVTDAAAKRWKGYAAIGDDMLRLLADREAMLEMIEELSEIHTDHDGDFATILKARALIAAVKGE